MAENSWHKYDMKKLRHCHLMYRSGSLQVCVSDITSMRIKLVPAISLLIERPNRVQYTWEPTRPLDYALWRAWINSVRRTPPMWTQCNLAMYAYNQWLSTISNFSRPLLLTSSLRSIINQKALIRDCTDHFSNILADREFLPGCYLLTVSNLVCFSDTVA